MEAAVAFTPGGSATKRVGEHVDAVALVALFVALGGTSYATVSAAFPPNSVGTKQIRDNSVTRAKVAHESTTNVLVEDGGLLAKDFATGQLPSAPTGPAGPVGPQGPNGDKGDTGATGVVGTIVVRTRSVTIPAGSVGTVSAGEYEHVLAAGTDWKLAKGETGAGLSTVSLSPSWDDHGVNSYVARGENKTLTPHVFADLRPLLPRLVLRGGRPAEVSAAGRPLMARVRRLRGSRAAR